MSIVNSIPKKQKEADLSGYVPNTTTVNGKALDGDITLSASNMCSTLALSFAIIRFLYSLNTSKSRYLLPF